MRIQKSNSKIASKTGAVRSKVAAKTQYNEATAAIMCAIEALGNEAKAGDGKAKDAIANLSVVMFDLK